MKKYFFLFTLALTIPLSITISFATDKGDAEYVLKSTLDPAHKTKLAFFPHARHQEQFDCATCHHGKDTAGKQLAYTEGQPIEKCESCHNTKSGINNKFDSFKKAAHARCKTCHTDMSKEGKATGPTKCSGCHKKDLK